MNVSWDYADSCQAVSYTELTSQEMWPKIQRKETQND